MKKKIIALILTAVMTCSLCSTNSYYVKASDDNSNEILEENVKEETGLISEDEEGERWLEENSIKVQSVDDLNEILSNEKNEVCTMSIQEDESSNLPSNFDNSYNEYFPEITYQDGGSCVSYSITYYLMTYQYNKYYNTNAEYDYNKMSPIWTYNLTNDGKNAGSSVSKCFNVLKNIGVTNIEDVPEIGAFDRPNNYFRDYHANDDLWEKAQQNKIKDFYEISIGDTTESTPIYSKDSEGLMLLKSALANNEILTFSTDESAFRYCKIVANDEVPENNSHVGETIVPRCDYESGGGHQMTIVGYNDDIWFDINEDGEVQELEKGAFKVANSWGKGYENSGFVWISYDALNKVSAVNNAKIDSDNRLPLLGNYSAYGLIIEDRSENEEFYLELDLSTSKRNTVEVIITDVNDKDIYVQLYPFDGKSGGEYGFDGTKSSSNGKFIFNLSEYDERLTKENILNDGIRITLIDNKDDDASLKINNIALVDRKSNTTTSLIDNEISINNESIDLYTKNPIVDAPTSFKGQINNENKVELTWNPSKESNVVYQIFKNDKLIIETEDTSAIDESEINGEYKYEVRAVNSEGYKSKKVSVLVKNAYTKIYYKNSNYSDAYIHYKIGNNTWTTVPGIKMDKSNDKEGYFEYIINLNDYSDDESIVACFNNGNGNWDNNNSKNYIFTKGIYMLENGNISSCYEPLKISGILFDKKAPQIVGSTINIYPQISGGSGDCKIGYRITINNNISHYTSNDKEVWCPSNYGIYDIKVDVIDNVTNEKVSYNEKFEIQHKDHFDIKGIDFDKQWPQLTNSTIGLKINTSIDNQIEDLTYSVEVSDSENRIKSFKLKSKESKNEFVWDYSPYAGLYYLDVTVKNNVTGAIATNRFEYNISEGKVEVESLKVYSGGFYGTEIDTTKASSYYKLKAKIIGGSGNKYTYNYGYYFEGKYYELGSSSNNYCEPKSKIETPGDYVFVCTVTDTDGSTATNTCDLKITQGDFYFESITMEPNKDIKVNDTVKFNFNSKYALGDVEYKIIENDEVIQDFKVGDIFNYTTKIAGYHTLIVLAKDSRGEVFERKINFNVNKLELKIDSFNATNENNKIIFNMKSSGGEGTHNYRFVAIKDGKVMFKRDFAESNTAIWEPEESGVYNLYFKVKDDTGSEVVESISYTIYNNPTVISSKTNLISPQKIGTPIKLDVEVAGGVGNINCKFIAFGGNYLYTSKNNYFVMDSSTSGTWIPDMDGEYQILVDITDETGKTYRQLVGTYIINK